MDELGLDSCAVVGSSGVGAVALQVAATVPERVSALVLLCAAAEGVEPTAELRAFAERETALLHGGDGAGATELNVDMSEHAGSTTATTPTGVTSVLSSTKGQAYEAVADQTGLASGVSTGASTWSSNVTSSTGNATSVIMLNPAEG